MSPTFAFEYFSIALVRANFQPIIVLNHWMGGFI